MSDGNAITNIENASRKIEKQAYTSKESIWTVFGKKLAEAAQTVQKVIVDTAKANLDAEGRVINLKKAAGDN